MCKSIVRIKRSSCWVYRIFCISTGILLSHNFFVYRGAKCLSQFKQVKGVFTIPRLSKKAKQEWNFFINPKTGRITYNSLCRKCKNKCKQSHKAIVVFCPKYKSKRGAKSVKNRREYDDSG